ARTDRASQWPQILRSEASQLRKRSRFLWPQHQVRRPRRPVGPGVGIAPGGRGEVAGVTGASEPGRVGAMRGKLRMMVIAGLLPLAGLGQQAAAAADPVGEAVSGLTEEGFPA